MARRKPIKSLAKERKPEEKRPSNAERSAYFARREAAKVLRSMLQGDARRRAVGSIKSLVYSPSIRNKKATFALVCQTLKHLSLIKDVMDGANVLTAKWRKQEELMYIITYDFLFGQKGSFTGDAEKYHAKKRCTTISSITDFKAQGVKDVEDLVALDKLSELQKPRYVRVNTLKIDTEFAIRELGQQHAVQEDDIVPDLLILPPGADLHNPLVMNGSIFLQGKASSMAAVALGPKPGWEVIDACSAPGNKTVHLAALMKGEGKILACELNKERVKRLKNNVKLAGATNVKVMHEDFLNLDPRDPSYSKVRAILLDPSCSGSGTAFERLDHLLPSHNAGGTDQVDIKRLQKLACFQKKSQQWRDSFIALVQFIKLKMKMSSTLFCIWLHPMGFNWQQHFHSGLAVASQLLTGTDLTVDKEGFFIALFVRKSIHQPEDYCTNAENRTGSISRKSARRKKPLNIFVARMLKVSPGQQFKLSRKRAQTPASKGV
ncbi:25S rRNA (cytosine-C(5))-methyltransferase NSUN5 [Sesamum angolense]|uniref:25S rRNA (Cytosine-C(5))-methyltransferase NSUN5 n=1 Tax=Sesamum angolense TaxID=2727404 RepID=A0AAE1W8H0_9LAMI|nr:25S rRNA (cytosine-C(5))-methyltransferase NSUN5 [Sesamum angolense]